MKHYVYKTTILSTGEYYIGKHSTSNLNDGYIGSGVSIKEMVNKETPINFEIIQYTDSSDEAYELEIKIIGNLYLTDPLCLNRVAGGKLGYADNRKGKKQSLEWKQKIGKGNSKPKTGKALEACIKNAKLGTEARRGQKDSDKTKRKRAESLSKALTGVPQLKRRKRVIADNKEYIGMQAVCDKFNITRQTVYNRIKSADWDWRYA